MRSKIWIILIIGLGIAACRKDSPDRPSDNEADSIMTVDSAVSGISEVSPDSLDGTLPVDSTDYDVDSIKHIK